MLRSRDSKLLHRLEAILNRHAAQMRDMRSPCDHGDYIRQLEERIAGHEEEAARVALLLNMPVVVRDIATQNQPEPISLQALAYGLTRGKVVMVSLDWSKNER